MKIKLILFDLDGTLIDSLTDLHETVNEMLEYFSCPKNTLEQTRLYVGNGMKKLVERSLTEEMRKLNFSRCMAFFVDRYRINMNNHTEPYPDVLEMLEKLKENGIKTAVISNKNSDAVKMLCGKMFGSLIDRCIGVDNTHPPKPDTAMAFEAMNFFGANPNECLMVGDGETDVRTAKNAGTRCIASLWGLRKREELEKEKPDFFADEPKEILDILKKNIDL